MDLTTDPTLSYIRNRHLTFSRDICKTASCHVFEAFDEVHRWNVVVKLKIYSINYPVSIALREIETMNALNHSHVVQLYDYFSYPLNSVAWVQGIVMEPMAKDLLRMIKERKSTNCPLAEGELMDLLCQLTDVLETAQKMHICHRDIKPQNVFVTESIYKLGDFGSSKEGINETVTMTLVGTPCYLSPQSIKAYLAQESIVRHNPYKSDVFSLGMTVLAVARLSQLALSGLDNMQLEISTAISELQYSPSFKQTLSWMLADDQDSRPDFIGLQSHLRSSTVSVWEYRCIDKAWTRTNFEENALDITTTLTPIQSIEELQVTSALVKDEKTSDFLQCSQCGNQFPYSRTSLQSCGLHKYCEECLKENLEGREMECPICCPGSPSIVARIYGSAKSMVKNALNSLAN